MAQEQIIAFNLEDGDYADIEDGKVLYELVKARLLPGRMNYIFLDEVQRVNDFQVAYTVIDADGKALTRELAPLNAISDHNPKYLLTMDLDPMISHNGIKQVNVLDWLLK